MSSGTEAVRAVVLGHLRRVPRFARVAAGRIHITALAGLTNRSYRICADGESWVLKIPGPGTDAYIDRRVEMAHARAAARLGIAPEPVWQDTASGVSLTRFIDAVRVLDGPALREPAVAGAALGLLRRLHSGRAACQRDLLPYHEMLRYVDIARRAPQRLGDRLPVLERCVATLASDVPPAWREATTLCHIDPAAANFIDDGERLWLLDWEYAGRSAPLWDVAYLAGEAGIDAAAGRDWLGVYLQRAPRADDMAMFAAQQRLVPAVGLAWCAAQLAAGNDAADFGADFDRLAAELAAAGDAA